MIPSLLVIVARRSIISMPPFLSSLAQDCVFKKRSPKPNNRAPNKDRKILVIPGQDSVKDGKTL
jgi:hypothetical protein